MTDERTWLRYAAVAGIGFVVLALVSAFLPGAPPAPDDPIADLRAYYADHRTAILIAQYLAGVAAILSLFFIAGLWSILRRAEGGDGILALTSFGAGVATNAIALIPPLVIVALSFEADQDDSIFRALNDIGFASFALVMFPWATFTAAASIVILRTGVLARWLGWAGLVTAIVMLVAAAGIGQRDGALASGGPVSFLAIVLGMLWILGVAIYMLRSVGAERPVASAAPA